MSRIVKSAEEYAKTLQGMTEMEQREAAPVLLSEYLNLLDEAKRLVRDGERLEALWLELALPEETSPRMSQNGVILREI